MEQHPVPQNVTQYQFRLVGDMTLKQFLELAGGILLAYMFYSSNLLFFIKWPLVLLSVFLGIGLAFFPIEERPLDQWIVNFLKAIYHPTRYVWKKTNTLPSFFTFTQKPAEKPQITKTFSSSSQDSPPTYEEVVDEGELDRINKISSLIDSMLPSSPLRPSTPIARKPKVVVRKLNPAKVIQEQVIFENTPKPKATAKVKKLETPKHESVSIERSTPAEEKRQTMPIPTEPVPTKEETVIFQKATVSKEAVPENIQQATSITAPTPLTPSKPNIVVGMVTDTQSHLVENAIVQILDKDGIPQRAVKTNQIGQFSIATPLLKGSYIVEVEKDGITVPPQKISADGKIIQPIHLQATA